MDIGGSLVRRVVLRVVLVVRVTSGINIMKIKLLSRDVELVYYEETPIHDKELIGYCDGFNFKLYFQKADAFATILHECMEFYLVHCGARYGAPYSKESLCDIPSKLIEQLMIENGDDIIKELKEYAEVEC